MSQPNKLPSRMLESEEITFIGECNQEICLSFLPRFRYSRKHRYSPPTPDYHILNLNPLSLRISRDAI